MDNILALCNEYELHKWHSSLSTGDADDARECDECVAAIKEIAQKYNGLSSFEIDDTLDENNYLNDQVRDLEYEIDDLGNEIDEYQKEINELKKRLRKYEEVE